MWFNANQMMPINAKRKSIGTVTGVVGVVLFISGILYNFAHVMDGEVPFLPASQDTIGYLLLIISAFIYKKRSIAYVLIALLVAVSLLLMITALT